MAYRLLLFIAFVSYSSSFLYAQENEHSSLPNILLIIADDLGYADLSCAGLISDISTPNIDRLAQSGIRFAEAYDNSPICNQSRIGIITGSYPQRQGSYWYGAEGLHIDQFVTIPEVLKEKNYHTGYIGKVHYGRNDRDVNHRSFPLNHGFDYYFGHTSARKHYIHHVDSIEAAFQSVKLAEGKKGQSLRQGALWENQNKVDTIAFFTDLVRDKSLQFIEKHAESPFFLQIAFNAAHNFTHQLPEEFLKKHNLSGYHDWDPAKEKYYDWYVKSRYPNNEEGRAHYLGQVFFLDQAIGAILDHLEAENLRENTLIFFISDNGGSTPIYADNTPLRGSKYLLYEGGIRTQMLVSYPERYAQNIVNTEMISAMDIFPTICQETGIAIPEHLDGKGLSSLCRQMGGYVGHEYLVWDTGHERAVRKGNYKLRISYNDDNAKYEMVDVELGEFLYDLEVDVGELDNIKSTQIQKYLELYQIHESWKKRMEEQE